MIGKTTVNYTLKHLIGSGGMAVVYLGINRLGKKAAIKILKKKFSDEPTVHDRFMQEARIMVDLDHNNIRKVYDISEIEGQPAIIMEYLEGQTLRERIDQKKTSNSQLKKYFEQCKSALTYTHSKGIIHRDIKPSNIFITDHDEVKIVDFGIAKTLEGLSHTVTGQALGTIAYMSPEQVRDPKRVDSKTDVYSLGVTFFHALTGKIPYDISTGSAFTIQRKIVDETLDILKLTEEWRGVIQKCLEKDVKKRKSFLEVSIRMEGYKNDETVVSSNSTGKDYKLISKEKTSKITTNGYMSRIRLTFLVAFGITLMIVKLYSSIVTLYTDKTVFISKVKFYQKPIFIGGLKFEGVIKDGLTRYAFDVFKQNGVEPPSYGDIEKVWEGVGANEDAFINDIYKTFSREDISPEDLQSVKRSYGLDPWSVLAETFTPNVELPEQTFLDLFLMLTQRVGTVQDEENAKRRLGLLKLNQEKTRELGKLEKQMGPYELNFKADYGEEWNRNPKLLQDKGFPAYQELAKQKNQNLAYNLEVAMQLHAEIQANQARIDIFDSIDSAIDPIQSVSKTSERWLKNMFYGDVGFIVTTILKIAGFDYAEEALAGTFSVALDFAEQDLGKPSRLKGGFFSRIILVEGKTIYVNKSGIFINSMDSSNKIIDLMTLKEIESVNNNKNYVIETQLSLIKGMAKLDIVVLDVIFLIFGFKVILKGIKSIRC